MSGSISNRTEAQDAAAARRILDACLSGVRWSGADLSALIDTGSPALFSILAEGLSDRFEARLADAYGEIFAQVIAAFNPRYTASALVERYGRVRRRRRAQGRPSRVYVLSRVTLGADIAITSMALDAAKRRFPDSRILLAGGRKNYELFSADPRIQHAEVAYDRAAAFDACWFEDGIVLDPDSRLTQLGLVPVCPEENYFFFDSRSDGGDSSLGDLARKWLSDSLGVSGARAYLACAERPESSAEITISLGVGENEGKRIGGGFEAELIRALAERGSVIVDSGGSAAEAARVRRAIADSGARVETWEGSFAGFASIISRARLYAGYDSAGQHAAAAGGVPLVSVFAGYPCERFCDRWRPSGPGRAEVIRAAGLDSREVLRRAVAAVDRLLVP